MTLALTALMYGLVARKDHKGAGTKMARLSGAGPLLSSEATSKRMGKAMNARTAKNVDYLGRVGTVWYSCVRDPCRDGEVHSSCVGVMEAFFDGTLQFAPHPFCAFRTGTQSDTLIEWPALYEDDDLPGTAAGPWVLKLALRFYNRPASHHLLKLASVPTEGDGFAGTPPCFVAALACASAAGRRRRCAGRALAFCDPRLL